MARKVSKRANLSLECLEGRVMMSANNPAPSPMSSTTVLNSLLNQLKNTAFEVTANAFEQEVSQGLATAGQAVAGGNPATMAAALLSLMENENLLSPGAVPTSAADTATAGTLLQDLSSSALQSASEWVGNVGPLPGVLVGNALANGFNGLNSQQQAQVLGQAALQTLESGLDAIPVVGDAVSELLDLGAATNIGQQAV